jgi:hypothetical protein
MRNADELDEQWRDLTEVPPPHAEARVEPRVEPRFEPPAAAVTAPQADLWVLVSGGIAAAAAFAAAFVASGGVAAHAATPQPPAHSAIAHNITVQACPTAVPGR